MKNKLAITAIENAPAGSPLLLRGDLVQAIHEATALGYDAVEIHVVDAATFPLADFLAACRQEGITVSAIVTGQIFTRRKLCITSADEVNRDAAMREVYSYIDLAAALNATDGIVIGWIKGNCPGSNQKAYYDLLAEQLRLLGTYAASKKQRILVEVINRYETNVFNTASELVTFLDEYRLENVFIHMDTFHMNIDEADMAKALRTAGRRLGYMHFADSNREYPGAGHIDYVPIMLALKEIGYSGALSVECIPAPDYKTAAYSAKKYLDSFLNDQL